MKKVKPYLPFEIDFTNSDMHSELIEWYGAHGLGIYFIVLMELRNHEGYQCSLSSIKVAARRCLADPEILESVLCDFGLFEFQECDNRILISSVYIDRVMQPFDEKTGYFPATVNENTDTVERPVHGKSTVTHREIINKIEIKIKTKTTSTTTNKEAASAANVTAVVADAVLVNELSPKAGTPESGKSWAEHLEKVIAGKQQMQLLTHFIRQATAMQKRIAELPRQHEKQAEKRSPHCVETVDPATGKWSYFGNIIPRGSPSHPHNDAVCSIRIRQWIEAKNSQPILDATNATVIWFKCNRHSARMKPAFDSNETGIQSRIG